MPFRFPLQTLLRLRENVEKSRWHKVQSASQALAAARHDLERLDHSHVTETDARSQRLRSEAVRASELHFWRECDLLHTAQRETLVRTIHEFECALENARQEFFRVRRDREVVSKLRDRAHEEYQRERAKQDQIAADENFMFGQSYRE